LFSEDHLHTEYPSVLHSKVELPQKNQSPLIPVVALEKSTKMKVLVVVGKEGIQFVFEVLLPATDR
jgi:hypothetical protein